MKITQIVFEKKITKEEKDSLGQYSNEMLRLEATISEEENRDLSILNLMELVHIHLGVEFKSKVKDLVDKTLDKTLPSETVPTAKDTIPSDPQLDRPAKVDEAAEKLKELKDRKDEEPRTDATKKPRKPRKKAAGKTEAKDEGCVPAKEVKEEIKEEVKPKGVIFDKSVTDHKAEIKRILTHTKPDYKTEEGFLAKMKGGTLSKAMEGKVIYTPAGKISKKFHDELVTVINGL